MTRRSYDNELVSEVLDLTLRCQTGDATEDERARLNVFLAEDPVAREIYLLAYHDTASLIRSALAANKSQVASWRSRLSTATVMALAAAACVMLALVGWTSFFPAEWRGNHAAQGPGTAESQSVGRIVRMQGVKWANGAVQFKEWSRLAVGQSILLDAGVLELMLDNTAQIKLEGPADFQLSSPDEAVLRNGSVVVRCGPEAVGYRVVSPDVDVVDLGTEFGVSVREGLHTDVVVYDGEVDLKSRAGASPVDRRLRAGEALHFSHGGASQRIAVIRGDQHLTPQYPLDRGCGTFPRIARVRDNLGASETAKYYRVVCGGFGEDCRAYVDRRYEWNGAEVGGLPPALVGGDYIMTFNDDKAREIEIEIELTQPSTLYVLFDDRVPTPDWLTDHYVDSGWNVGMDEVSEAEQLVLGVGPGESIDHSFSVWRRDCPAPTTITLGAIGPQKVQKVVESRHGVHGILESMYGVVVTKLAN